MLGADETNNGSLSTTALKDLLVKKERMYQDSLRRTKLGHPQANIHAEIPLQEQRNGMDSQC